MKYHNQRIVQLSPIHIEYYRVVANITADGELWWKERVISLALVDEWSSQRCSAQPADDDDVERSIRAVHATDTYLDVNDGGIQTVGFFSKDDLDNLDTVQFIETEATRIRASEIQRRQARALTNSA